MRRSPFAYPQLERTEVALRGRTPRDHRRFAAAHRHRQIRRRIRRGHYRHRPRQQIVVRGVRVVQPEVVLGAGQHIAELDLAADGARRDRRVGQRRAVRRKVVEPVRGVLLAKVAGYFDHDVGRPRRLRQLERNGNVDYNEDKKNTSALVKQFITYASHVCGRSKCGWIGGVSV